MSSLFDITFTGRNGIIFLKFYTDIDPEFP